jgi:alpha-galactosidase
MLDICRDMERYCPEALLLNYTNPMSMLCRAMQRASRIQLTGLCHSVQGTAHDLAGMIGAPMKEISFLCAGINHQAWFLEVKWKGKDAYPLVRKAITSSRKIYYKDAVRNEMFLHLDYYVTESSGHNSEYNWWFRKRPDLIKKYCVGTGWNPGEYAISVKKYPKNRNIWRKDVQKWFAKGGPISLERGHEFATYIINSLVTDEPYIFNGSVANKGLITNLPPDASVEVPVLATKRGLQSIHVGALPAQCAALNNASLAVEEMAVEAALTGDPRLVMQSILYDPLCASVLSMAEIRKMVREMLRKNRPYLPQFKSVEV